MKPDLIEKKLNELGAENWAVIYANEAIIILGRREQEGVTENPRRGSTVVLVPSMGPESN